MFKNTSFGAKMTVTVPGTVMASVVHFEVSNIIVIMANRNDGYNCKTKNCKYKL